MSKRPEAVKGRALKIDECHDCGVFEGETHELGCDMEACPFCGGQLISCDCRWKKSGRWRQILEKKGRVPYIQWPQFCARCGEAWPDFFVVSSEEWQRYIEPDHRRDILCRKCYDRIKQLIDNADQARRKRGAP